MNSEYKDRSDCPSFYISSKLLNELPTSLFHKEAREKAVLMRLLYLKGKNPHSQLHRTQSEASIKISRTPNRHAQRKVGRRL